MQANSTPIISTHITATHFEDNGRILLRQLQMDSRGKRYGGRICGLHEAKESHIVPAVMSRGLRLAKERVTA